MLPENAGPYRMRGAAVCRARGARGRERLRRGCGKVYRKRGPATITLVVGAGVVIPRGITSVITLASAVRTAAAPKAHLFFPCLEYRAVSAMCGELGIEEGEPIFLKGARHRRRLCSDEPHIQQRLLKSAAIYSRRRIML